MKSQRKCGSEPGVCIFPSRRKAASAKALRLKFEELHESQKTWGVREKSLAATSLGL